jgi:hypothetical protein
MSLLSDVERERLIHRPQDSKTRASNDVRVRKKLRSWLQYLTDVALILEYLPEDQIVKEIVDDHDLYSLLYMSERLMEIKKFYPVVGPIENPEKWEIIIEETIKRPAGDDDIERTKLLGERLNSLSRFIGDTSKNPICRALKLDKLERMGMGDRIKDDEKAGLEKLKQVSANMVSRARAEMVKHRDA